MVTNVQYPHVLQLQEETGQWASVSICRDQPNDRGKAIHVAGGTAYQFASTIYMPSSAYRLLVGQDIRVIGAKGEKRIQSEIKRVSVESFHVRIWV